MGEIVGFIIVGLVVGILARLLMPGRDPIGILGTIVVGIVGAVIGGYLFSVVFELNDSGGVAWIGSIIVAMALLYLYRKMTYGRTHHTTL
ncbi:MAG: GlsB/YeaQ/YmgE family stress response membrane protein [Actinomycetota bacterium]|nr:GlsB/YeaQ/YmgE family stress response membrane protein [Actinomycetota bacterium]